MTTQNLSEAGFAAPDRSQVSSDNFALALQAARRHERAYLIELMVARRAPAQDVLESLKRFWLSVMENDHEVFGALKYVRDTLPEAAHNFMTAEERASHAQLPAQIRVAALPGSRYATAAVMRATQRSCIDPAAPHLSLGVVVQKSDCALKFGPDGERLIVCFRADEMSLCVCRLVGEVRPAVSRFDRELAELCPVARTRALMFFFQENPGCDLDDWIEVVYRWWPHLSDDEGDLFERLRTLFYAYDFSGGRCHGNRAQSMLFDMVFEVYGHLSEGEAV